MVENHIERIRDVQVFALLCECGMCGGSIEIEFDALDDSAVDPIHDFGECPECGATFDATAARFSAHLNSN